MSDVLIDVKEKIASWVDGCVVCNNTGQTLTFNFDDEWSEIDEKTARFIYNGEYKDVPFTGNSLEIPILKNVLEVEIGVYGGNLKTTRGAYVPAITTVLCKENISEDKTVDLREATATAEDVRSGEVFFTSSGKATGTMPDISGAEITPTTEDMTIKGGGYLTDDIVIKGVRIEITDADAKPEDVIVGKVFYNNDGKQEGTQPLDFVGVDVPRNEGAKITPTTNDIVIPRGQYLNGDIVIKGDPNLLPENIPIGTTLFDIPGSAELKTEEDSTTAIWNAITNYGNRRIYNRAFLNDWTTETAWTFDDIKPPYVMKPSDASGMFTGVIVSENTEDLSEWTNKYVDFSDCEIVYECFRDTGNENNEYWLKRVGILDLRKVTESYGMFYNSQGVNGLETIDEIKFSENMNFDSLLLFCTSLRNCVFTGTITTSQSFTYSPLSGASVRSLIACLTNYAGTENEFANTLTLTEQAWANVNADTDNPPPSGADWQEYVMSVGWTT